MTPHAIASQLEVSRIAVALFLETGLTDASVEAVAARSGRSARTIWRYFGSREGCAAPLLTAVVSRFIHLLARWPLKLSIEQFLASLHHYEQTDQENADDLAALRLLAAVRDNRDLRAVWLSACSDAEPDYAAVVARRSGRPVDDYEVRLCAATTLAAMRSFYEWVSLALAAGTDLPGGGAVLAKLGAAIRAASTLPICDPIPDPSSATHDAPTAQAEGA